MAAAFSPNVLGDVREVLPSLRARSEQCERDRSVPNDSLDLIRATGLFRLFQPRRYGGLEGTPQEFFDALSAIGGACASTGWVAGVFGSHQFIAAHFSERAQDDLWANEPESVVSGTGDPTHGTALPVDGGYMLNGQWGFASGSKNATWHFVGATIEVPNVPPERAFFLLRSSEVTYLDTWYVGGLCGTGSNDAVVKECFVPEHRVLKLKDVLAIDTPGMQVNTSILYRISVFTILSLSVVSPIVGAALEATATVIASLRERMSGGGVLGVASKAAESPLLQRQIAEASATMSAVSALITSGLNETWAQVSSGEMSVDRRIFNRRDYAFAVRSCVRVMNLLYETSGSGIIYVPNTIERAWRDVHAASKHTALNWDAAGPMTGRHLVGLDPRAQF